MAEKYFAATPYTCHKQFLISIIICKHRIMAYGNIQLKLKDFEGIYAPADKKHSHFLGQNIGFNPNVAFAGETNVLKKFVKAAVFEMEA